MAQTDADGFQVVRHGRHVKRGRNKNNKDCPQKTSSSATDVSCEDLSHDSVNGDQHQDFNVAKFQKKLAESRQEILLSSFFSSTLDLVQHCLVNVRQGSLRKLNQGTECLQLADEKGHLAGDIVKSCSLSGSDTHILSYGIGNFSSCPIARYQLALLIALRMKLEIPCDQCFLFDPVFLKIEQDFLTKEGFQLISENEEGKRPCHVPTLAFLPHCGKALYNNLLWCNMKQGTLGNLVLLGNSFSSMIERTPSRHLKTANYVVQLQPCTSEAPLPSTFHHGDVFNDLSLHTFSPPPDTPWDSLPEPIYDPEDAEFIPKVS